jgi:hypothetical protein
MLSIIVNRELHEITENIARSLCSGFSLPHLF